jgi:hypothetical protein
MKPNFRLQTPCVRNLRLPELRVQIRQENQKWRID